MSSNAAPKLTSEKAQGAEGRILPKVTWVLGNRTQNPGFFRTGFPGRNDVGGRGLLPDVGAEGELLETSFSGTRRAEKKGRGGGTQEVRMQCGAK